MLFTLSIFEQPYLQIALMVFIRFHNAMNTFYPTPCADGVSAIIPINVMPYFFDFLSPTLFSVPCITSIVCHVSSPSSVKYAHLTADFLFRFFVFLFRVIIVEVRNRCKYQSVIAPSLQPSYFTRRRRLIIDHHIRVIT